MHFYRFNIGLYAAHTRHLSLMEDLAYRRMLDVSYTTELPLPLDVKKLARTICMRDQVEDIQQVLEDFYTKTEDGWIQKRVVMEIAECNEKAQTARKNGKKGGRPKNPGITQPDIENNPAGSKKKPNPNPEKTGWQATYYLLPNTQYPVHITQDLLPEKEGPTSKLVFVHPHDLKLFNSMLAALKFKFPKMKEPKPMYWINQFRLMRTADGKEASEIWEVFNWAHNDSFWAALILTPRKLREKYDTLYAHMKTRGSNGDSTKHRPSAVERVAAARDKHIEKMAVNITPN
ncbi:YdaU family protein [Deltaproteobacteria bacterium]|nr:YdaU family protein [Deltaproteobacteria bacterium]